MYGRGGPQRGGYYGNSPPGYYNNSHGHWGPPHSQQYYDRGYGPPQYPSQHHPSHHGSQGYSNHPPPYSHYPSSGSSYYQQSHSGQYHGQYPSQGYQHSPPPHASDGARGPPQRPSAPSSGGQKAKSGHFANLSWTPGGRKSESGRSTPPSSSKNASPAHTATNEEEDNPFRPPKDMRAEDEERPANGRKPVSFVIKGSSGGSKEPTGSSRAPPAAPPPRMVKEIVIRKRLKARPELLPEHVKSESVYYRKGDNSVIGTGTYGKVYKAIHVYTKAEVALKMIRMEGERDGFPVTAVREIRLLQDLDDRNVVAMQEVMVEKNACYMVFEYLAHDLTGVLNHPNFTLSDAHKKHFAKQMFQGLDYLHGRGILHRDLKAANILISKTGQLKLADFGLARFYNKSHVRDYTNRVVTIWYRSPELLLGETRYTVGVDVWAAACVMVEIFTRHAIFAGEGSELSQLDKIYSVMGTPRHRDWPKLYDMEWFELMRPRKKIPSTFAEKYQSRVSTEAFDLLQAMLKYDPDARPTCAGVLEHDYFTTEEPAAAAPVELEHIEGDWHEFESKALRRERDREARRRAEKERADQKARQSGGAANGVASKSEQTEPNETSANGDKGSGPKRAHEAVEGDEAREAKKVRTSTAPAGA